MRQHELERANLVLLRGQQVSDRIARGTPDPLERAAADKHYPTDPRGQRDPGAHGHIPPCIKRTWCVLADDHPGSCVEVPRYPINPGDFGPRRTR